MPVYLRATGAVSIDEFTLGLGVVAETEPPHVVSEPCQFQRQLPESAEMVVKEIFPHVLSFGENENLQLNTGISFVESRFTT